MVIYYRIWLHIALGMRFGVGRYMYICCVPKLAVPLFQTHLIHFVVSAVYDISLKSINYKVIFLIFVMVTPIMTYTVAHLTVCVQCNVIMMSEFVYIKIRSVHCC